MNQGPMTIRIHEADGTPYEHIVELKDGTTKFDIPYNTKYKRLKRSRRQKERAAISTTGDYSAEGQDDVLLYCLGDVLQSEEEISDWKLGEWGKEDEDRMSLESYEWIRMDADFEWICRMSITMPGYMYLSQLQQDRDVVAQLEVRSSSILMGTSSCLLKSLVHSIYGHPTRTSTSFHYSCSNSHGYALLPWNPYCRCSRISKAGQRRNWLARLVPS